MKDSLEKEVRERIFRCLLDVTILRQLENARMSGYELAVLFMKKFGFTVSTSTVYTTLYALEREGLMKSTYYRRTRVFELTEKGKKKIEDVRDSLVNIQGFIRSLIGRTG